MYVYAWEKIHWMCIMYYTHVGESFSQTSARSCVPPQRTYTACHCTSRRLYERYVGRSDTSVTCKSNASTYVSTINLGHPSGFSIMRLKGRPTLLMN